jgi:hypothetical protein
VVVGACVNGTLVTGHQFPCNTRISGSFEESERQGTYLQSDKINISLTVGNSTMLFYGIFIKERFH